MILCTGRNVAISSKVRKELFDFHVPHLPGVSPDRTDLVKNDVPFDPPDLALFGVPGVVQKSKFRANLIQQLHGNTPRVEGAISCRIKSVRQRGAAVIVLCRTAR